MISFEKIALELSNKNVGLNVDLGFGLNVGLNKTEKAVLRLQIKGSDRIVDRIRFMSAGQRGTYLSSKWIDRPEQQRK